MPGESPAIFGDALRRLAAAATYLYQDGNRFWYSTQPTVTKLAEDRAEQLKREPDKVQQEIERRVRIDVRQTGDFSRVHPVPHSGQDVPDDLDARLVVLSPATPHVRNQSDSPAIQTAQEILETRGSTPRLFRNTLVFLAADKNRLQDLDEAVRRYLAWESILQEKEALDLSPFQVRQAEEQKRSADTTVVARLPETYQWLLVPVQQSPHKSVEWQEIRLQGNGTLAVRASKKLQNEELLITTLAGTRLRMELDRIPLWRGNHVEIRQLIEDFARYVYLPRLKKPSVLVAAVQDGLSLLSWEKETFAYADSYDEVAKRYRGLRAGGQHIHLSESSPSGLLVKPEIVRVQLDIEKIQPPIVNGGKSTGFEENGNDIQPGSSPKPKGEFHRFHGSVKLDPTRVGRDAGRIAEEVIAHLAGLPGADVKVTLEIEAYLPDGISEEILRTIKENCSSLKFDDYDFESE